MLLFRADGRWPFIVGLAIAVQMLVGIRYHGMMLRTFRRVCVHVINMLRELVLKGTSALEASIPSPDHHQSL